MVSVTYTPEGADAPVTKIYAYDSATITDGNILDLKDSTDGLTYIDASSGTIDLSELDATSASGGVIYGVGENYSADNIIATLTPGTNDGEYTLTAGPKASSATTITAATLTDESGNAESFTLTTEDDTENSYSFGELTLTTAKVPAEQTTKPAYTVNGTQFTPQTGTDNDGELTISIAADKLTLIQPRKIFLTL